MFKSLIIILAIGVTSYVFTDLDGESTLVSVVLPIIVFMSLVSFAIWLVIFIRKTGLDKEESIQKVENNAPISPDDIGRIGGDDGGG